jgi:hypothetical protein
VPGRKFDHHGRGPHELEEDLLARGAREVEGERLLVAAQDLPPQPDAVLGLAVGPGRVRLGRVLDLDHVRPEVSHDRGRRGAGEEGRDVEDPDVVESV